MSRRVFGVTALAVSATLATSGCDTDTNLELPAIPGLSQQEQPDADRVAEALAGERAILDRVRGVQRRHPSLRRGLDTAVDTHRAHVELLDGVVDDAEGSGGEDGSTAGTTADPVASDPARALGALARLERALSEAHVATAMRSRSGTLARVVGSMSAAAAQQAVVLGDLASGLARGPGRER